MGILSKVWKGLKTAVKSTARRVKKAFQSFGKFMNKIGIVGQIAMMFILPAIGNAIMGTTAAGASAAAASTLASEAALVAGQTAAQATALGAAAASQTTATIAAGSVAGASTAAVQAAAAATTHVGTGLLGGALGPLGVSAGKAMSWVGGKVAAAKSTFQNITSGVFETLGNFAKTATNKLANTFGFDNVFQDAAANFFSPGNGSVVSDAGTKIFTDSAGVADSAFSRSFGADSKFQNLTKGSQFFKDVATDRMNAIDKLENPLESMQRLGGNQKMTPEQFRQQAGGVNDIVTNAPEIEISTGTKLVDGVSVIDGTAGATEVINAAEITPTSILEQPVNYEPRLGGNTIQSADSVRRQAVGVNTAISDEANKRAAALVDNRSLLQKTVDGTVGVYDEITGKVAERFSNVIADPVGTLLDGVESKMVTGVQNRGLDELGLIYRQPAAQVDNRTFNANASEFSVAPVGQYSGEPIMSANAFETNVTHSSSPYGFTAMLYGDYQKNFVKP
tara:strand:- start:7207 stop:8727 length:1521 start_codon:yes stop_codon:yes gene_type:complete